LDNSREFLDNENSRTPRCCANLKEKIFTEKGIDFFFNIVESHDISDTILSDLICVSESNPDNVKYIEDPNILKTMINNTKKLFNQLKNKEGNNHGKHKKKIN